MCRGTVPPVKRLARENLISLKMNLVLPSEDSLCKCRSQSDFRFIAPKPHVTTVRVSGDEGRLLFEDKPVWSTDPPSTRQNQNSIYRHRARNSLKPSINPSIVHSSVRPSINHLINPTFCHGEAIPGGTEQKGICSTMETYHRLHTASPNRTGGDPQTMGGTCKLHRQRVRGEIETSSPEDMRWQC